jgi:hypothetical protein
MFATKYRNIVKFLFRLERWLQFCRIDKENVGHNSAICAEHFEQQMFLNTARNRLVWNAVPTLIQPTAQQSN